MRSGSRDRAKIVATTASRLQPTFFLTLRTVPPFWWAYGSRRDMPNPTACAMAALGTFLRVRRPHAAVPGRLAEPR
jgi:hypothetical protein